MSYYESKMEMALAEILGVSSDTIEMLNLTIENNIGNDDCFYGYYVEFPKKSDIDTSTLSTLEQSDIEKIPWGETEYYTEGDFANTSVDPFGYKAEWEAEFYNQALLPSKEEILQKLDEIENILNNNTNTEIIVKSLMLSAFSTTEGFMRSIVYKEIPEIVGLDDKLKDMLQEELKYKLSNNNTRIKLYKDLTGKTLKPIPYIKEVRNNLAHNMLSVRILNNDVVISNENENNSYNINDIIDELKKYVNNPTTERE